MFIDSNIFLYAIGDKDLVKQKIAQSIITNANACISVQVINEVSVNALKKLNFTEPDLRRLLESCYARYSVLNLNLAIFELASNLRDKYNFSYFDSIIVATAIDGKCETLYSEDMQHGLNVMEQLRIVNPLETSFPRTRKSTNDTLPTQPHCIDRTDPLGIRQVSEYSMPNVSDKVLRIIHSYTDYVNRVVWKKY